jgi:hypothetical protein
MSKARNKRRPRTRDPTGINANHVEQAITGVDEIIDHEEKVLAQNINKSFEHKVINEQFNTEASQEPVKSNRPYTRFQQQNRTQAAPETRNRTPSPPRRYEKYDTSSKDAEDDLRDENENESKNESSDESIADDEDDLIEQLEDEIQRLKILLAEKDLIINQKDHEISKLRRANRRTRPKESDF